MASLIPFEPHKHQQEVLSIFLSRPDIFPANEIEQISQETNYSSTKNHYKIVAIVDNQVAGYIGAILNSASHIWSLDWFAVSSKFQKMGVGSKLIDAILSYLHSIHASEVQVQTCSCDGEALARSFYTRHGFIEVNVELDGYALNHSKITYSKSLKPLVN